MISTKDFNELIKGANKQDLNELIHLGINEIIPMTDKQLLKLINLKEQL